MHSYPFVIGDTKKGVVTMRIARLFVLIFILLFWSSCAKKNNGRTVLNRVDSLARQGDYVQAQVILYNYIKENQTSAGVDSLIRYYNWLGKKYKQAYKKTLMNHYNHAKQTIGELKHRMIKDIEDEGRIAAYCGIQAYRIVFMRTL